MGGRNRLWIGVAVVVVVVGCGSYDGVRGLVVGVTVDRLLQGGLNPTANSIISVPLILGI